MCVTQCQKYVRCDITFPGCPRRQPGNAPRAPSGTHIRRLAGSDRDVRREGTAHVRGRTPRSTTPRSLMWVMKVPVPVGSKGTLPPDRNATPGFVARARLV